MTARPPGGAPLLDVEDLRVSFPSPHGPVQAVDGVSFQLERGEVLAIVGESGSGKSACAMSLVGLVGLDHVGTAEPARVAGVGAADATVAGSALLDGRELIGMAPAELRAVRGAQVAMIFQDPMSCLNPVMRVGEQIAEQIRAHEPGVSHGQALERAAELMERMRIPAARERVRAYPHELSGGMRQRVMIAMALCCGPRVLLADEPTTALDVTVQAQILAQLRELRDQDGLGIVLITHDFAVVAQLADRVAVMRAGRIVEQGDAADVLSSPQDPYTRELLAALRPAVRPGRRGAADRPPLVEVEELCVVFSRRGRLARARAQVSHFHLRMSPHASAALAGVSLEVRPGETLAVVGESGAGKTTLLRAIARLIEPDAGTICYAGQDIAHARRRGLANLRRSLRVVFQDPQASLNPRRRVGWTLGRTLRTAGVPRAERPARAAQLLEQVGLTEAHAARFPHELSGGERQRVAIARALAAQPSLVLLDEPVSSLDASLRAGVLALLAELQERLECAYVLVSHDLTVVAGMADRIAVMQAGEIVELGDAEQVLNRPSHPYTRELLAASPRLPGGVRSATWEPQQS